MAPLEIRHRSVRPISAKHAQASRFLQQSQFHAYGWFTYPHLLHYTIAKYEIQFRTSEQAWQQHDISAGRGGDLKAPCSSLKQSSNDDGGLPQVSEKHQSEKSPDQSAKREKHAFEQLNLISPAGLH
jgi:hypothetical protein